MGDHEGAEAPCPQKALRRPFPTFWQGTVLAVATLLLTLGTCLGLVVAMMLLRTVTGWPEEPLDVAVILSYPVAFGGVLALAVAWARTPLTSLFPFRRASVRFIAPLCLALLGLQMLTMVCNNLLFALAPPPEEALDSLERLFGVPWASMVILVVLAPVCEELLFRGVILQGFLRNYRPVAAVAGSTALFVLVHANPWQILGPLVLGAVMGWFMYRVGTLWLCMVGHAFWNGAITLANSAAEGIPGYTSDFAPGWAGPASYLCVSLVLTAAGFGWLSRLMPSRVRPSADAPFPSEGESLGPFDKLDAGH